LFVSYRCFLLVPACPATSTKTRRWMRPLKQTMSSKDQWSYGSHGSDFFGLHFDEVSMLM
jgi:hypothetical protein